MLHLTRRSALLWASIVLVTVGFLWGIRPGGEKPPGGPLLSLLRVTDRNGVPISSGEVRQYPSLSAFAPFASYPLMVDGSCQLEFPRAARRLGFAPLQLDDGQSTVFNGLVATGGAVSIIVDRASQHEQLAGRVTCDGVPDTEEWWGLVVGILGDSRVPIATSEKESRNRGSGGYLRLSYLAPEMQSWPGGVALQLLTNQPNRRTLSHRVFEGLPRLREEAERGLSLCMHKFVVARSRDYSHVTLFDPSVPQITYDATRSPDNMLSINAPPGAYHVRAKTLDHRRLIGSIGLELGVTEPQLAWEYSLPGPETQCFVIDGVDRFQVDNWAVEYASLGGSLVVPHKSVAENTWFREGHLGVPGLLRARYAFCAYDRQKSVRAYAVVDVPSVVPVVLRVRKTTSVWLDLTNADRLGIDHVQAYELQVWHRKRGREEWTAVPASSRPLAPVGLRDMDLGYYDVAVRGDWWGGVGHVEVTTAAEEPVARVTVEPLAEVTGKVLGENVTSVEVCLGNVREAPPWERALVGSDGGFRLLGDTTRRLAVVAYRGTVEVGRAAVDSPEPLVIIASMPSRNTDQGK